MNETREEIATWCQQYVADLLEVPVATVDLDADFDRLGIDSALAVSLLIEVEDRYGVDLPPEALFDNPTLNAVAAYLHEHPAQPAEPPGVR
ncbi:MAG TPA: acyl carrier protein [Pseudonocardiaceae bacterium]|nr:acyl carrier protein [Pseudonocardiaceae bacterium]